MATGWSGIDPSAWADQKERLLTALLRNSVQALANEAGKTIPNGGRVPVRTGNLARSVVVDNVPPKVIEGEATAQDLALGVSKIVPGGTVYIGWQAAYARRMNYGYVGTDSLGRTYSASPKVGPQTATEYRNNMGFGFAEAAAAKWPSIVAEQAAKLGGK